MCHSVFQHSLPIHQFWLSPTHHDETVRRANSNTQQGPLSRQLLNGEILLNTAGSKHHTGTLLCSNNNKNWSICKAQNLVCTYYSKCTHAYTPTHTQTPAHTSILTTQNLIYTQMGSKQRLETDEDSKTMHQNQTAVLLFCGKDH